MLIKNGINVIVSTTQQLVSTIEFLLETLQAIAPHKYNVVRD